MKRILENVQQRWKSLAPQRRILFAAVVATLVVGGFVVMSKANQVTWAVLYANVDDKTASDVLAKLDAHGIQHQLAGNGTRILVPKDSLDSTRLTLAGEGVTGQAVPAGFDQVFDNNGLSTTDFAQKVNYQRGLEGELAKTLLTMDPVSGARVQLSIPDKSVFVGSTADNGEKPSASVMLSLRRPLTSAEVDTVASLISSSVPGLALDQVTVASSDGSLLKAAGSGGGLGGGAGSSASALEMTQQWETDLANRLTNLVRKMTGSLNAAVSVKADIDFTQSQVEQQKIDPTLQTPSAENHQKETYDGTGSPPGGITGVDGGPTDASAGATTNSYEKINDTITYTEGDKTITHSTVNTPTVKKLGIAVVIPPIPADATYTIQQIQDLVSAAANLDTTRDSISVAESAAAAGPLTTDGGLVTDPTVAPAAGLSPVFVAFGVIAGATIVLLLGFFRRRRKAKQAKAAELAAAIADPTLLALGPLVSDGKKGKEKKVKAKKKKGKDGDESDDPLANLPVLADPAADKVAMEEIRSDLEKILAESPESLASLLSTWMTK